MRKFNIATATGAVFIDTEKAFDKVKVICRVIKEDLSKWMIKTIKRKKQISQIEQPEQDFRQGSVLGPLLFNIKIPQHSKLSTIYG